VEHSKTKILKSAQILYTLLVTNRLSIKIKQSRKLILCFSKHLLIRCILKTLSHPTYNETRREAIIIWQTETVVRNEGRKKETSFSFLFFPPFQNILQTMKSNIEFHPWGNIQIGRVFALKMNVNKK